MAHSPGDSILVSAGTRDGLYLLASDLIRQDWQVRGPYLSGMDVAHAILDQRDGRTIYAAATSNDGTAVYRSCNRGESWEMAGEPFSAEQVWHVEPATEHEPGVVYAGVRPATLYRSEDRGNTWSEVAALSNHPTRGEWWPGGGGLCLHTILMNPHKPKQITVGISVAGTLLSDDGGQSWQPRNNGVLSFAEEFTDEQGNPAQHPDVHRCVHKIARHPSNGLLYQQNHMGVYRSENEGIDWIDISDGLPNRFGFVIGVTADGSVYVVPQHDWEEEIGVRVTGQLAVCRMKHGSDTWETLINGLPEVSNLTLYREGLATDRLTPGGVYFGDSAGTLHATADGGDTWRQIASGLPSIRSVSCEHYSS